MRIRLLVIMLHAAGSLNAWTEHVILAYSGCEVTQALPRACGVQQR